MPVKLNRPVDMQEREGASFAETALKLGGKSDDEARRTGAHPSCSACRSGEPQARGSCPHRRTPCPARGRRKLGKEKSACQLPGQALNLQAQYAWPCAEAACMGCLNDQRLCSHSGGQTRKIRSGAIPPRICVLKHRMLSNGKFRGAYGSGLLNFPLKVIYYMFTEQITVRRNQTPWLKNNSKRNPSAFLI